MGSAPTATNTPVHTVDSIINTTVMTLALGAAETAMEAAFPPLDWPIVKQVFELGMQTAFQYIDTALEQLGALATIDVETNAEAQAYQAAVAILQAAINSGDPNAINSASATFSDTLGKLIHWDGS